MSKHEIPGFPGYTITQDGKVFGIHGRELRPGIVKGYKQVVLMYNGVRYTRKIHRLVILTFIGPSHLSVNHINGIKTDNNLENLEYCTHEQNMAHASNMGLMKGNIGGKNSHAKLTADQVKMIRRPLKGTYRDLAKLYGVSPATISSIITRRIWKNI